MSGAATAHAYQPKWTTVALGPGGQKLEFVRDHAFFNEGRAGERVVYHPVQFSQRVVSAEVMLSGFNMWYTRGGDCEVSQIRVDAWVEPELTTGNYEFMTPEEIRIRQRTVSVKLMFSLKDEDPSGPEDYNDAAIGFTVIAQTEPD